MLIQFNFENYKSFLNKTNLDMTATPSTEHLDNLIEYKKDEKYLKTLSIYGANASGKSAVLQAFLFMRNWVVNSFKFSGEYEVIPRKEFQFNNKGKSSDSTFEVFFSEDNAEYQYGFTVNDFVVLEEWLYKRDFRYKSNYKVLFERRRNKFNLSEGLKSTEILLKQSKSTVLAISILSGLNIQDVKNVYRWFIQSLVLDFGNYNTEEAISQISMNAIRNVPEVKRNLIKFLKQVGIELEGLIFKEKSFIPSNDPNSVYDEYDIFTLHRNSDTGGLEELRIEDESGGTRKFIDLFASIFTVIETGAIIFIDELSAKLHPLLTRYLIILFNSKKTNPKNAQLIFTTHDTTILTKDLFRRDQICFVEKNEREISELVYLYQYKEENTEKEVDLSKEYLSGRYGAIPNFEKEFVEDWNGRSII